MMQQATMQETRNGAAELRARYRALKGEQPGTRARNAAKLLGVTEAELVASQVGHTVTRLRDNPEDILSALEPLGQLMALTRNEHCVHERKGIYKGGRFSRHGRRRNGIFVNPDIDLRLFMDHWCHAFAVTENTASGPRHSLQFFDPSGTAVHKIYLTEHSDREAYNHLVREFRCNDQSDSIAVVPCPAAGGTKPDSAIDRTAFRTAWAALRDTHDFYPLLKQFGLQRLQALRLAAPDQAWRVDSTAVRQVLEAARNEACPVMVFVGNRGCIQIHTGTVDNLLTTGPWYNVLDPLFNLHLREDAIAQCWVTRKPTDDGIVSALEVFSANDELIVTLFGKRKPGVTELTLWRDILCGLSATEATDNGRRTA